jgi:hypothetical protein
MVMTLLRTLKAGNLEEATDMLGDNACRCPPEGGWVALLKYEHGHEPSLAFLVGHPFDIGRARTMWVKDNTPSILPWEVPESTFVDVPLTFAPASYSPYFLPLHLAYGQTMTIEQFQAALNNLRKDGWKAFSLRLRPSLQAGTVPPPPAEKERSDKAKSDKAPAGNPDGSKGADLARELLGKQALFLVPRDAGSVVSPAGEKLPIAQVEAQLPQLRSCTLRLRVERRGQFKPWRVSKLKFLDAVVQVDGQPPITLLTPEDTSIKNAVPNPVPQ